MRAEIPFVGCAKWSIVLENCDPGQLPQHIQEGCITTNFDLHHTGDFLHIVSLFAIPDRHSVAKISSFLYLLTFTTTSNGIKSCFEWFIYIHLFSLFVWLGLKYSSYQRERFMQQLPGSDDILMDNQAALFKRRSESGFIKWWVSQLAVRGRKRQFFSPRNQPWEKGLKECKGTFFKWAALPEKKIIKDSEKNNRVNKSRSLYVRFRSTWKHKAIFM